MEKEISLEKEGETIAYKYIYEIKKMK